MTEERQKALEELVKASMEFTLNMSDTFAFATADCETMSEHDFEKMVPVIAKHGQHAFTAYVAVKRGIEPITCPCGHDGPPYQEAKKEVLALKEANKYFLSE